MADPQKKGRAESGVKYLKSSFQPLREFRSLADANAQLMDGVMGEAGNRCHGAYRLVLDGKSYRAPRPLKTESKTQLEKEPETAK